MKNKLFLSLSLLTAAFVSPNHPDHLVDSLNEVRAKEAKFAAAEEAYNAELAAKSKVAYDKQVAANHAIYKKELTRTGRTQLALGRLTTNGVSFVKAHPKSSGAVAAAMVAGLGYLAYKKYTTPKTVQAAKVTPAAKTTPVVAAPAYVVKRHVKGKGVRHCNRCVSPKRK